MYTDDDLESAAAAGILSRDQAAAFRNFVRSRDATPAVDEERFRLVTGFNDIFVSIAAILLLFAVNALGRGVMPAGGPAAVAATSWALAEYFTRQRRMALPSILLLLTFVGGIFWASVALLGGYRGEIGNIEASGSAVALRMGGAAAIASVSAFLHWRRFQVPITVAAGVGALVATVLALLLSAFPGASRWLLWILFAGGLAVFFYAMWWDMSDPARQTRRSDVAFWLHLIAAPMIAHPIFWASGLFQPGGEVLKALAVVGLYIGFGLVALAVDRRALLVSALGYVLYAISTIVKQFGGLGTNFALTALLIGSALLLLSALWHRVRVAVVSWLPADIQRRLPPVDGRALSSRSA